MKICYWRSEIIRYCRLFSSLSVGRRIQIFKMECWMRILENETLWKPACPERHRPERHRPQNRIRSFTVVWRFWSEDSRISSATFYMGPCQETKPRQIKVFSRDGCTIPRENGHEYQAFEACVFFVFVIFVCMFSGRLCFWFILRFLVIVHIFV